MSKIIHVSRSWHFYYLIYFSAYSRAHSLRKVKSQTVFRFIHLLRNAGLGTSDIGDAASSCASASQCLCDLNETRVSLRCILAQLFTSDTTRFYGEFARKYIQNSRLGSATCPPTDQDWKLNYTRALNTVAFNVLFNRRMQTQFMA